MSVIVALSACSHQAQVSTVDEAKARIDQGTALNARTGTYRVPGVRVTLMKVTSLGNDELGLWFSFDSKSPDCCSLFPRLALTGADPDGAQVPYRIVVVPSSDVAGDGTLSMRLFNPEAGRTYPFTVDLGALGVSV